VTVVLAALALLVASARGAPLGPPAAIVSALGVAAVCLRKRESPRAVLAGVSWSSLVLVAALFTIVRALEHTGVVALLARAAASGSGRGFDLGAGLLAALACNAMNNLPAGMLAAATLSAAHADAGLHAAVAVAVDLGPNLSLFGSLSSVLWLLAVRREGIEVSAWRFAVVGLMATPLALVAALLLV
jgi:arsenical pump membrane protein